MEAGIRSLKNGPTDAAEDDADVADSGDYEDGVDDIVLVKNNGAT